MLYRTVWLPLFLTLVSAIQIHAKSDPLANFLASATDGCAPLEIEFFDDSNGAIDSLRWEFEGGTPSMSSEEDPIINYLSPGVFKVTLSVFSGTEVVEDFAYIEVREPAPVPSFKMEKADMTFSFENTSAFDTDFQWDFGDGQFSDEKNPSHTYSENGTYLVSLKATNSCASHTEVDVVVVEDNQSPPTYTANDIVDPYVGYFKPGVNLGYFPPWNDRTLADIAVGRPELGLKGAGVKAIRPGLFDSFIHQYGWDARVENYQHFENIGLDEHTLIVGFPAEEHRDPTFYCNEHQSELFADLYTPIWDNGEGGTPINDDNDFAVYLYKLVNMKKDYVKFWEIWNEPGFDFTNVTGYLPPGTENNWWENNPDPCDYKLRAPIFHYVRILRISYEIIKAIDPDAYVTLASVGYPSFLDAVCRNTDNPNEGAVTGDFPLKGGAYFDAIGIHTYPHFDGTLREWNDDIQGFDYFRHTDKAITTIPNTKASFQSVLSNYGYDGQTYPEKEWIITEINVPRKAFLDFIGSEEAQINFLIKAQVESIKADIRQIHVFDMAESHYYEEATTEFQMMGFYQRLYSIFPYDQIINNGAMAYKTCSDQIYRSTFDESKTAALALPDEIDGAAFLDIEGYYTYVLWAKTTEDMSEVASATYSFPSTFNINQFEKREWDASYSEVFSVEGSQNISLSGTPIFLKDLDNNFPVAPTPFFEFDIVETCVPAEVNFTDLSTSNATNWEWTFPGGTPSSSTEQNPTVHYANPGVYSASLKVSNAEGENILEKNEIIEVVNTLPTADFNLNIFGTLVSCDNFSEHATSYIWDMGDSNIFTDNNPSHAYATPGYFEITLYAINGCDTAVASQEIIILPEEITPRPEYSVDVPGGCPGVEIQFNDASSSNTDTWYWVFSGGEPSISEDAHPLVTYDTPGSYDVLLVVGNDAGTTTKYREGYITISEAPTGTLSIDISSNELTCTNLTDGAEFFVWDFGNGDISHEYAPTYNYPYGGEFTVNYLAGNYCDTLSYSNEITASGVPQAIAQVDQEIFCTPAEVAFSNQSSGEVESIRWYFPNGTPETSTENNVTVQYDTAGIQSYQMIVTNGFGADTLNSEIEIIIHSLPTSNFEYSSSGLEYTFTNTSIGADSYEWDFGDGQSSEELNPIHTYNEAGEYIITLKVFNQCGSISSEQTTNVSTGIHTLQNSSIKIYPNPSSGKFALIGEFPGVKEVSVNIYNTLGEIISRQNIITTHQSISHNFNIENIAAGSYFIEISNGDQQQIKKLIIQ